MMTTDFEMISSTEFDMISSTDVDFDVSSTDFFDMFSSTDYFETTAKPTQAPSEDLMVSSTIALDTPSTTDIFGEDEGRAAKALYTFYIIFLAFVCAFLL